MGHTRRRTAIALAVVLAGCLALAATPGGPASAAAGPAGGPELAIEPADSAALQDEEAAAAPASPDEPTATAPTTQVDADRTRIDVALEPDGDAVWTLELWTRLEDDADREAFASLEADVANDSDAYAADFAERMAGTVDGASESTGREMAIQNVTASTRTEAIPQDHGVLTYEFRWTGFAAVDGTELRAGDAIDAFPMDPGTRLTIRWPEAYRATAVEPEPDDRADAAASWRGESTDFLTGEPRVVLTSEPDRGWLLPAALAAIVLLTLAVGGWLVRTGRLSLPGSPGDRDASEGSVDAAAGPEGAVSATGEPASGDGGGPAATAPEDPPAELLSNEERVLRLLRENGGRMKQQQVVAELGWTEAKTSQVVTSMHDEDRIEKFRIGRENVLALPGEGNL